MRVHAQQHLGPVVGVGAAVAGVDREDRAGRVVRAVEQRLELELLDELFEPLRLRRALRRRTTRPRRPFRSSRPGRRCDLIASSSGVTIAAERLALLDASPGPAPGCPRSRARPSRRRWPRCAPSWPPSQRESRSWRMPSRIAFARSMIFFFHGGSVGQAFSLTSACKSCQAGSLTYAATLYGRSRQHRRAHTCRSPRSGHRLAICRASCWP